MGFLDRFEKDAQKHLEDFQAVHYLGFKHLEAPRKFWVFPGIFQGLCLVKTTLSCTTFYNTNNVDHLKACFPLLVIFLFSVCFINKPGE